MERGLTHVVSLLSPCPHWPYSLEPQVMTSSGVMATVCSAPQDMALQKGKTGAGAGRTGTSTSGPDSYCKRSNS